MLVTNWLADDEDFIHSQLNANQSSLHYTERKYKKRRNRQLNWIFNLVMLNTAYYLVYTYIPCYFNQTI